MVSLGHALLSNSNMTILSLPVSETYSLSPLLSNTMFVGSLNVFPSKLSNVVIKFPAILKTDIEFLFLSDTIILSGLESWNAMPLGKFKYAEAFVSAEPNCTSNANLESPLNA